jgi:hypothetical protein
MMWHKVRVQLSQGVVNFMVVCESCSVFMEKIFDFRSWGSSPFYCVLEIFYSYIWAFFVWQLHSFFAAQFPVRFVGCVWSFGSAASATEDFLHRWTRFPRSMPHGFGSWPVFCFVEAHTPALYSLVSRVSRSPVAAGLWPDPFPPPVAGPGFWSCRFLSVERSPKLGFVYQIPPGSPDSVPPGAFFSLRLSWVVQSGLLVSVAITVFSIGLSSGHAPSVKFQLFSAKLAIF